MRVLRMSLAVALVALAVAPAAALAQGPLEITTPFPSVIADPGATAKFATTVTTDTPQRVDLTVVSEPDGWTTRLRGGGSTIAAVTTVANPDVAGEISAAFSVEVTIPDDVEPGQNQVVVEARSAAGLTQRLTLDVNIEQVAAGSVKLESDFPSQSGSADANFQFDLELRNASNQQVTFNFEVDGPVGWRVQARPSGGEQATTAVIDAGGLSSVSVTIDPPSDAAAGTYPIIVRALGGPAPAEAELTVEITGSYGMTMTTEDNRLSARVTVGSPTTLVVVVANTGTAPLENVTLTSSPPRNWEVNFESETIPSIEPGATVNVPVTIVPAGNAVAGDYVVSMRARTAEANDEIDIRTTVETSPVGGLLGIGVLALVAIGLFFVFQRYGRR